MDIHLSSWFSYVFIFLLFFFMFSNFKLFCVCFDFQFWLKYLICECVDFFSIKLSLKKIGIEKLFCLLLFVLARA